MMIGTNIYTAIGLFGALGFMLLALLATYPATRAYTMGRSFSRWYLFSLLLFPFAFIASFSIHNKKRP